jgi:hypothetical protein
MKSNLTSRLAAANPRICDVQFRPLLVLGRDPTQEATRFGLSTLYMPFSIFEHRPNQQTLLTFMARQTAVPGNFSGKVRKPPTMSM